MRARPMGGWSDHGPDGDRNQRGGQDGPGDEPLPHQAESVGVMNVPGTGIVHRKPRQSYELVHRRKQPAQCEPMPRQRIEPACPVKTISKASPTWVASMAVRPASPSRRRARTRASAMRTSWQSATPAKPIERRRRPNQDSGALSCLGNSSLGWSCFRSRGRRSKWRLARVLDLLGHRLVADHQRHHVCHHRQPPRRRVRRSAGGKTANVSAQTAAIVSAQVMLPGMKQRIMGRPLT